MTRLLFLALMLLLVAQGTQIRAAPPELPQVYEKIHLKVGGQRTIHLSNVLRLTVSRRGVIHILEGGPDQWHITGLRAGVVALEIHQRGGEKKTWYVEIEPKDVHEKQSPVANKSLDAINPPERIAYNVKANIELIESSTLESIGGTPNAGIDLDLEKNLIAGNAVTKLTAKESSFTRKILGTPSFQVLDGVEAIIKSGGETIHNREDKDAKSTSVWHEYGMSLTVRISPDKGDRANAEVLFVLRAPSATEERYSLNQIQTSASVVFASKTLLGTVELATDDQTKDKDIFLSSVPIIGPLFKRTANSMARAVVQLWLEVQ